MLTRDLLHLPISYQTNTWTPITKELTIGEAISEIKSDSYLAQVNNLRQLLKEGNEDGYGIHKKRLPSVTFCGSFNGKRKKEFLKNYNSIIVIDIDNLTEDELRRIKKILQSDQYVFSFWESPSQRGLKGLVSVFYDCTINPNIIDSIHKCAFQKLSEYFLNTYQIELDESGSDTTRLCFFSSDPNIVVKENIDQFIVSERDITMKKVKVASESHNRIRTKGNRDILFNPRNKNSPENRKIIQSILKFLTKKNLSITSDYEKWYRIAYAIANSFTYDIGEKYYLSLCKLDGPKHDDINSKNMLRYCYENSAGKITFNSIIYFANQKGYQMKSQRGGVPKATST